MSTADAILRTLESPNVSDANGEMANVADVIAQVASAGRAIADAITPGGAAPGQDAAGGSISSLTEALMGVQAGLHAIAGAIGELAETVANHGS